MAVPERAVNMYRSFDDWLRGASDMIRAFAAVDGAALPDALNNLSNLYASGAKLEVPADMLPAREVIVDTLRAFVMADTTPIPDTDMAYMYSMRTRGWI